MGKKIIQYWTMDRIKKVTQYWTLLLFWPLFGMIFGYLERYRNVQDYIVSYCRMDDFIPFNEWFIFPYMFWFVYLIGMLAYLFFCDKENFRRMMKYIIIANSFTLIIFILFPTVQNLRPAVFPRDNLLTRFIGQFYLFDTNTNVAPSLHVIDSMAVMTAALNCKRFSSFKWKAAFIIVGLLICVSTVFLKQHSVIDIFVALPICFLADHLVYGEPAFSKRRVEV